MKKADFNNEGQLEIVYWNNGTQLVGSVYLALDELMELKHSLEKRIIEQQETELMWKLREKFKLK